MTIKQGHDNVVGKGIKLCVRRKNEREKSYRSNVIKDM